MPKVIAEGNLIMYNFDKVSPEGCYDSVKLCKYYIMPLYEMNLKQYMSHFKSPKERYCRIFEITKQLLGILKYVHAARRTFNDMKLENIMINTNGDFQRTPQVFLIDFGFSKKFYKDKNSVEHIEENTLVDSFQGNILFSSHSQMSFHETSRRDDL